MVAIPRSQGIQARPEQVTPTVRQPVDTGQQYIAQGISQLGGAIADIGAIAMIQERKQQDAYEVSKILDYKTQLRRFDNQEKIRLAELGATPEVIEQSKKDIADRRKLFSQELRQVFGDNKRLQALADQEEKTSFVDLEYTIDKNLSDKRREYAQNSFYENISNLKNEYENANSPEEFNSIALELGNAQKVALSAGIVDFKDLERIEKDFREIRKEKEREIARQSAFAGAMRGEFILDPTDKDSQEVINKAYEDYALDSEDPEGYARDISINTGIVPKEAKSRWVGALMAGNPKAKINAAANIMDLLDQQPTLQNQFSENETALARAIYNRTQTGLTEDEIVEYAMTEIDKNLGKDELIRKQEFEFEFGKNGKKFKEKLDTIRSRLKDRSGIPIFDPEIDPTRDAETKARFDTITADVARTAKDLFIKRGLNVDDAIDEAENIVMSQWGITEIGGKKRYQKYSPEIMYPNFPKKALQKQVYEEASKYLPNKDVIQNQLRLEPVPETLNSNKVKYYMMTEDDYGAVDILRDSQNMPAVFTPDITKTEEYKKDMQRREELNANFSRRKTELRKQHKDIKQKEKSKPLLYRGQSMIGIGL